MRPRPASLPLAREDFELCVAHDLRVAFEGRGDLRLLIGRQHVLEFESCVNPIASEASMIAPATASPNDSPEGSGGGVHARRLTYPLLEIGASV